VLPVELYPGRLQGPPAVYPRLHPGKTQLLDAIPLTGDFTRDLVEDTLNLDPDVYGQTLDLSGLTRFRKIKWLRPTSRRYYLKPIDPGQILTPGGTVQTNRFYVAGTDLTITLSALDATLEIGYMQHAPLLTDVAAQTHWMLEMIPWAIIERAATQTFKSIGDDTSARFYEASSMELFVAARNDFEIQVAASAS
jgi:hypothetical protein